MKKSKLTIYSLFLSLVFIVALFAGCGETKKTETKHRSFKETYIAKKPNYIL